MALAGLIENRRQPEGWPNSLRVPEARRNDDRAERPRIRPDPRQGWSSTADRLHGRARAGEPCHAAWQTFHATAGARRVKCKILDSRFRAVPDEITPCHSSLGGE